MPQAVTIPQDYGYVLAVAAASTTVNIFHQVLTSRRRKAAGVPYPNAYVSAEEAEKSPEKHAFNAASKAHVNFGEAYPHFLVALGVSGLRYPVVASALGASWIAGRLLYAWGYARVGREHSANGRGRLVGAWASLPWIALTGMAIYSAVERVL